MLNTVIATSTKLATQFYHGIRAREDEHQIVQLAARVFYLKCQHLCASVYVHALGRDWG